MQIQIQHALSLILRPRSQVLFVAERTSDSRLELHTQSRLFEHDFHVALEQPAFRQGEERIGATCLDIPHAPSTKVWCWVLGLQLLSSNTLQFSSTHIVNLCGVSPFVMILFMNSYDDHIIIRDVSPALLFRRL